MEEQDIAPGDDLYEGELADLNNLREDQQLYGLQEKYTKLYQTYNELLSKYAEVSTKHYLLQENNNDAFNELPRVNPPIELSESAYGDSYTTIGSTETWHSEFSDEDDDAQARATKMYEEFQKRRSCASSKPSTSKPVKFKHIYSASGHIIKYPPKPPPKEKKHVQIFPKQRPQSSPEKQKVSVLHKNKEFWLREEKRLMASISTNEEKIEDMQSQIEDAQQELIQLSRAERLLSIEYLSDIAALEESADYIFVNEERIKKLEAQCRNLVPGTKKNAGTEIDCDMIGEEEEELRLSDLTLDYNRAKLMVAEDVAYELETQRLTYLHMLHDAKIDPTEYYTQEDLATVEEEVDMEQRLDRIHQLRQEALDIIVEVEVDLDDKPDIDAEELEATCSKKSVHVGSECDSKEESGASQ